MIIGKKFKKILRIFTINFIILFLRNMPQFIYNIFCWKGKNNRLMGVSKRLILFGATLEEARDQFAAQYRGIAQSAAFGDLLRDFDHFEYTGKREFNPTGEYTARGHAIFVLKYKYDFGDIVELVRTREPHEIAEGNFVIL
jgi:hypothetical protein